MRGILFVVAAVVALVAIFATMDAAQASMGEATPTGWLFWGVAMLLAQLAPPRQLGKDVEIEAAFFAAAAAEEAEALAAWPEWEGYVPPELGALAEPPVGVACEGVEVDAGLLAPRPTFGGSLTAAQKLAIAQQRAIAGELARKDLTSAEVFDLGLALIRAKKGLFV
jgi:hypothetical protein